MLDSQRNSKQCANKAESVPIKASGGDGTVAGILLKSEYILQRLMDLAASSAVSSGCSPLVTLVATRGGARYFCWNGAGGAREFLHSDGKCAG